LDTLAPLRWNGPYFVPHGPPAFARFAILLFHSRAKSAGSESRLQNAWRLDFERARDHSRMVSQSFTAQLMPCPTMTRSLRHGLSGRGKRKFVMQKIGGQNAAASAKDRRASAKRRG
jgi:hypothetical protein